VPAIAMAERLSTNNVALSGAVSLTTRHGDARERSPERLSLACRSTSDASAMDMQ